MPWEVFVPPSSNRGHHKRPKPPTAAHVIIGALSDSGLGLTEIARTLDEAGVRTVQGAPWRAGTIAAILGRRATR